MSIPIPRIRGNAIELANKRWGYEFEVIIGQEQPICMGSKEDFEGYETKEEAVKELKEIAMSISNDICKKMGVDHDGFYDLTKNEIVKKLN